MHAGVGVGDEEALGVGGQPGDRGAVEARQRDDALDVELVAVGAERTRPGSTLLDARRVCSAIPAVVEQRRDLARGLGAEQPRAARPRA